VRGRAGPLTHRIGQAPVIAIGGYANARLISLRVIKAHGDFEGTPSSNEREVVLERVKGVGCRPNASNETRVWRISRLQQRPNRRKTQRQIIALLEASACHERPAVHPRFLDSSAKRGADGGFEVRSHKGHVG
jgi:hypothetical protein